ncbi:transcriptional regulatory protein [Cnuibacter physcomitrellae]|uniref:Transcriptional regulatory protein n=1 Tax=Cnuibacter physcomitrellae TaxID=1619308 RepID=A0A1X9LQ88_9MICO|nr:response regulator [Cnuibacter physcomitrellae]ARJ06622.1 two-component system response regulator [Cnuibacter physcomitrellae]GGI38441.1 transcriptional regulatory protein [Cnuibacter physcomitrellae]
MTELRVLIIDDDFRVAGLHRDAVAAQPGLLPLEPVRTAAEAMTALREHRPDLVLADVYLPDGDGIEIVRASRVDAFVLSAAAEPATVRRAFSAGAVDFLVKPFETRALGDRLARWVRYRNLLSTGEALTQDRIDRAQAILHPAPEPGSLTRSSTERTVLDALGTDDASASDVAERCGVSRATAQRHLTALAAQGLVEVSLRYGATGRPEHRFRVSS